MGRIRLIAWALVGLMLAVTLWFAVLAPRFDTAVQNTLGQGDYRLDTTDGTPFTADTLKGAPSAVFFGYAHCPDVCPTTLGDLAGWQGELGDAARDLRIYFITVDPERDSLPMLRDYLSWSEGVTGVTGLRAEVDKALRAFRIYARKVGEGTDYTMDHTAYVILFDRDGRFVQTISYQEAPETALPKLRALLGG
ncbi:SCO family protein [Paenirhodobacter sp.]|uniref:SCO family protein n=1 Tax=Paenirhodobacter sp. TaxID=1965326 RepID=UPI003B3C431B